MTPYRDSDYKYFETSAGQRFLLTSHTTVNGQVRRTEDYFDGRKSATVRYDRDDPKRQDVVSIGRGFAGEAALGTNARPIPLKFNYLGKAPLYEVLDKAKYEGKESTPLGACETYLFEDVTFTRQPQSILYYLSEVDSLPLRVEAFDVADPAVRRTLWTWEAEALDAVDGHRYVKRSVRTAYNTSAKSSGDVRSKTTDEVLSLRYNTKFEEGRFWPVIERGVTVHDTIRGKLTPGSEKAAPSVEVSQATAGSSVGMATPPWSWTTYAPVAFCGIGGLLLLVGFVLARRHG